MSLQLIYGNSGSGKSHYLFQNIIRASMEHPERNYLVLVPEQFTMQTQKELVCMHPRGGIMNIDVLSFERLAYRVLEEVGNQTQERLEEIGKSFVLQKIAQDKRGALHFLGNNLGKPGYIYEMKSLISELTQYDITLDDLDDMIGAAAGQPQLESKLRDIRIVYEAYLHYLEGRYLTGEEVLDVLCDLAGESDLIHRSEFAFDGFTGFTPIQNKLLKELFRLSPKVAITVTLDWREDPFSKGSPHQLFAMSKKTIHTLGKMAAETRTEVLEPVCVRAEHQGRFAQTPALDFLEQNLFRYGQHNYQETTEEINIFAAKNPLKEIQQTANTVRRLIRSGYRYGDIAIITGDLEMYGNYVRQVFAIHEIPYFIDEKRFVLDNPFIEFFRSVLQVMVQNYSYDSIFRYLRSGMSDIIQADMDLLENYVLGLGIRGRKKWQEVWVRHYRGQNPEELPHLNEIRLQLLEELDEVTDALKGGRHTVREYTTALVYFLQRMRIEEKLKHQEEIFASRGLGSLVKEYAQVYSMVMGFLDKCVEVLGEEKMLLRGYQQIVEAGFMETKIGIIPPTTDQVLVGDMERTRLKDIKCLFFVGVNEGLIPKNTSTGGILSETDRDFIKSIDVELKPSAREAMYIQKFYLYLNLTKPDHELYLSYSMSDSAGEVIGPAYLIAVIQKLFPALRTQTESQDLQGLVEQPEQGMELLLDGLRQCGSIEPGDDWKELYTWYAADPAYSRRLEQLVEAAGAVVKKDQIGRSVAKALYGNVLENSATRLEQFASCAYAHFLRYGLGLQERAQYEFTGMDMGNIVHKTLEQFAQVLNQAQKTWTDITDEEREQILDESLERVVNDYGNTILHSSARNEYQIARVRRILQRTIWALQEQLRRSDFVPSRFEVSFQIEEDLANWQDPVTEEEKMRLKGRIDRMDLLEEDDHVYVKVMDYKTGNTSFDLVSLYHGLQLQLVVYMNAALDLMNKSGKIAEPAGIFYYNVKDPVENVIPGEPKEDLQERILKDLCVNGLVCAEKEVIDRLDTKMAEQEGGSSVIPVKYNKNGSLSKSSNVATKEQMQILGDYVKHKTRQIGQEILQGKVDINPYEMGTRNSCTYCPYKGVCGFDGKIPGYAYRRLDNMGKHQVWTKIEEEV
ncbi:MAG: helicase-exonuclease AddAB subunit AddB [Lachnospiraceae bacterium]|nr:helicase-exonuclease AddAB subunit AddB [Lachnospiraceae bacterium]